MSKPRLDRAITLHRSGQLDQAETEYAALLKSNPGDADAWHLSGLVFAQRGDRSEGRRRIEQAIRIEPQRAAFHFNLGRVLNESGLVDDAIRAYDRALVIDPRQPDALLELARLIAARRDFATAIALIQRALALHPERRDLLIELAGHYLDSGRPDASVATLQRILDRQPGDADIVAAIGQVRVRQGRYEESIALYRQALTLQPDCSLAEDGLIAGYTRLALGRQALAVIDGKLARQPDNLAAQSQRLFLLNYLPELSPVEVASAHLDWGRRLAGRFGQPPRPEPASDAGRRLRIGYVSADFRRHSVAYFIEPVLAGHHREQFEVFAYSSTRNPDEVTQRLAGLADHWRNLGGAPDEAVHQQILADRIDLLVDLSGHTADHRLSVFARRPAPVQLTWLGYPHSTGLPGIDFRLCDALSDPVGKAEPLASERLLRLPGGFLCYRPAAANNAPPEFVPPSRRGQAFTFGSFNHIAKISEPVIAAWSRLLRELPDSRLFLKAPGIGAAAAADRLRSAFAGQGIAPERLQLAGATPDHAAHLATYREVDIALDPFPYNGTTTTFDALWMGVPVLTLRGDRHAGRVGASLLTGIGHPELIAADIDDYVARALALAADPAQLAKLHRQLRDDLRHSPLMDETGFVARLEAAYRFAWQTIADKTTGSAGSTDVSPGPISN